MSVRLGASNLLLLVINSDGACAKLLTGNKVREWSKLRSLRNIYCARLMGWCTAGVRIRTAGGRACVSACARAGNRRTARTNRGVGGPRAWLSDRVTSVFGISNLRPNSAARDDETVGFAAKSFRFFRSGSGASLRCSYAPLRHVSRFAEYPLLLEARETVHVQHPPCAARSPTCVLPWRRSSGALAASCSGRRRTARGCRSLYVCPAQSLRPARIWPHARRRGRASRNF